MTRVDVYNAAAAVLALLASVLAVMLARPGEAPAPVIVTPERPEVAYVMLAEGPEAVRGVRDASGTAIAVGDYRRIVSASTVSDWLLSELVEPGRVVAYTELSASSAPWRHRFAGTGTITSTQNIEALLALDPDLLLVDDLGDPKRIARLRERGLQVFNIGQVRGMESLASAIARTGAVLGREERAGLLAERYERAMYALLPASAGHKRVRGMYLSIYGDTLFGGTKGTTYHEILHYAGLIDVAAEHFTDWPQYSSEHILVMNPEVIVTRAGLGRAICNHAGLYRVAACTAAGRIIELDGFTLDDPGLGMLEAAEALHRALHGAPKP